MSAIKEIAAEELGRQSSGVLNELHLYKEGSFLRAYNWSAWLACVFLNDFKVNKRRFKDVESPVVYIGFPDKSLSKWLPEGVEQTALDEKHLLLQFPDIMIAQKSADLVGDYAAWLESIPLTSSGKKDRTKDGGDGASEAPVAEGGSTLTSIMQQILAWPVESRSPLESMSFLADVKLRLAALI